MVSSIVLFVAICGLVSSTGFLVLVAIAAFRFARVKAAAESNVSLPSVTVLKPVCGLEPGLEENLASFFEQDYPDYEIIFGARDAQDSAVTVVRAVQDRYPRVRSRIIFSGEPDRANAKVCSLSRMLPAASYDYLVISDSDVHVNRDYLRQIVTPLLNPSVGLVTCVYRGVPERSLWSRLDALGMSVEMTSGVIVADLLEGMNFALGPSMALRREVLESVGGVDSLADYYADDFVLGRLVHESGLEIVLSTHIIEQCSGATFSSSMSHQTRWMTSTRHSRSAGHLGTGLTFAMPFGVLGLLAGIWSGHVGLGLALFVGAVLNRVALCILSGWLVVRDPRAWSCCWLYTVRDLMGFYFWATSYLRRDMVWRNGERYRFQPGGKVIRMPSKRTEAPSAPIAVDHLS